MYTLRELRDIAAQLSLEDKKQLRRFLENGFPNNPNDAIQALAEKLTLMGAIGQPTPEENYQAALARLAEVAALFSNFKLS